MGYNRQRVQNRDIKDFEYTTQDTKVEFILLILDLKSIKQKIEEVYKVLQIHRVADEFQDTIHECYK